MESSGDTNSIGMLAGAIADLAVHTQPTTIPASIYI